MSTPQEVSADELLHKTVAEQMESAKLEKRCSGVKRKQSTRRISSF